MANLTIDSRTPISIFMSYSHRDEHFRDELAKHLSLLRRQGVISEWHDRRITAGNEWAGEIDVHLATADIILLLISADFLASDYCYGIELEQAMERHEAGEARVIPVIVRPVDWRSALFGKLQALPKDAKPVTSWRSSDEAFEDIARGIRLILEEVTSVPRVSEHTITIGAHLDYSYSLVDVFKQSGVPTVTFVEPEKFTLLKLALTQQGRGVVIQGPSGIGKTTALKKAVEELRLKGVVSEFEILSARRREDVQRLSSIEKWHKGVVALDDFHRLDKQLREQLIDYLKYLADYETIDKKFVIIGIPQTGRKLVEFSFDVATRIHICKLGKVSDELILNMIGKGEKALNIIFDRKTDIVRAASGSLNIAQFLCFQLVARENIDKTQDRTREIQCNLEEAISEVMEQISLKFGEIVRCFASLGHNRDYTSIQILQQLARTEDGFLALRPLKDLRPDLAKGIDQFLSDNYMDKLYNKYPQTNNHLLFDPSTPALIIDDPQLTFYLLQTSTSQLVRTVGKSEAVSRNRVIVSYSHADAEWLERLTVHLKPLERDGVIDFWNDMRIQAGTRWREDIRKAIDSAKVAILLISADFLASDFITYNELPPLLRAAQEEGTIIIPVIISPSRYIDMESISQFQAINPPSKPLISMTKSEQETLFVKLAKAIETTLST